MAQPEHLSVKLYNDNLKLFDAMIDDIRNASKYIYLETYRFNDDAIGKKFRAVLLEKAKQKLDIKILVDAYGTKASEFFNELIAAGAKVRYFKKIKFFISNTFAKNNTRNHRKLLLIDDKITYLGSANLTAYCLNWRDLTLRLENPITHKFRGCFMKSYAQYKFYELVPFEKLKAVRYHGFVIVQDTPSAYYQTVRAYMLKLIEEARTEIRIETPYFLPGIKIRKALVAAVQRGVNVEIHIPRNSDVPFVDILRNKYLGPMFKHGIKWFFYTPDLLHAKCMLIDKKKFFLGSSNMDYRSFRFQYEIMLYGTDPEIAGLLDEHISGTEEHCEGFDYEKWKNTPKITRFMEWILTPFRRLF